MDLVEGDNESNAHISQKDDRSDRPSKGTNRTYEGMIYHCLGN